MKAVGEENKWVLLTEREGENGRRVWKKESHEKWREVRHASVMGSLFKWKVQ